MTHTDEDLISQYFKIQEKLEKMEETHSKATAPYREGMVAIKGMLHKLLNERNTTSTTVKGVGTCFKVNKQSIKVLGRSEFLRFVFSDPDKYSSMLTNHVAPDAVKEFMDANTNPPPGIEVVPIETVTIRRS